MTMNNLMIQTMISISEVMETMFYIPVEPRSLPTSLKESGLSDYGILRAASISFRGSFSGTIDFIVTDRLLNVMTANFMGEKIENLTDEHLEGTLKEALNMLAGNTFSKIDSQSSFCLGVPGIISPLQGSSSCGSNCHLIVIETLDGPIGISIHLD